MIFFVFPCMCRQSVNSNLLLLSYLTLLFSHVLSLLETDNSFFSEDIKPNRPPYLGYTFFNWEWTPFLIRSMLVKISTKNLLKVFNEISEFLTMDKIFISLYYRYYLIHLFSHDHQTSVNHRIVCLTLLL